MARAVLRPDVPEFRIAPAPRCFYREPDSLNGTCGELATHQRPGKIGFDAQYFCERHHGPDDQPITGKVLVHRLEFTVRVILAGQDRNPTLARVAALERLEAAIAAAGGILDIEATRAAFGWFRPSPAPGRGTA